MMGARDSSPLGEYLKIAEKLAKSAKRIVDKLDDEIRPLKLGDLSDLLSPQSEKPAACKRFVTP
jgi:hypothetical protein